jgi:hypothetical protein
MYTANRCIHINFRLIFQASASGPGGKESFHGTDYSQTGPTLFPFNEQKPLGFFHQGSICGTQCRTVSLSRIRATRFNCKIMLKRSCIQFIPWLHAISQSAMDVRAWATKVVAR